MPAWDDRMTAKFVRAPHPALLAIDVLAQQTQNRFQRRSGPGGQHRNKTSSGVFLQHDPTSIIAEATERRSQADNRAVAMSRLRYRLATQVRTCSILDQNQDSLIPNDDAIELELRGRYHGSRLKLNDNNIDKPAVLALLLNDLHAAGGQPSLVAQSWKASTTSIVQLIRSQPEAFALVNSVRKHHGRGALK